jgi:hypothetical protein
MTALDAVWVAIKGANGSEAVKIGFEDCNQTRDSELVGDYLGQGIITSDYGGVAIPLAEFSEIPDWSCMKEFNIIIDSEIPSGQGTIYVDEIWFLPAVVLVDDFRDDEFENELGGPSGPWTTEPVSVTTAFPNGALKMSYDVPAGEYEGGGYWTKLLDTNLLSWKDYLFFDVRGEQGGEEIAAEFIDCSTDENTNSPDIKVSDYMEGGIITDWRTVAIPLAAFVEVQDASDEAMDWTCIEQLAFNVSSQPEYNSGIGTVYIDDVTLVPDSVLSCRVPLLVDRFHDCNDRNALNWGWYTGTWGTAEFTAIPDPLNFRGSACGYRFTFDVDANGGGYAWTELKGLDVTNYSHLQLYIKGRDGNEATRVYLRDRAEKERFKTINTTIDWNHVMIPLSFYAPAVDLTDLSEIKFAYEAGYREGEVYVDDISFVEACTSLPVFLNKPCPDSKPTCPSYVNNYEPNNFRCSTTFELSSGVPIQSYICAEDDTDDYYYIDVVNLTPISVIDIELTGIPAGVDYDLYLYYGGKLVEDSNNPANANENITYTPSQTGRYYVRVHPYPSSKESHSLSPYTLIANYQ